MSDTASPSMSRKQRDEYDRLMSGFARVLLEEEPKDDHVVMALIHATQAMIDDPQARAAALTRLIALVRTQAS